MKIIEIKNLVKSFNGRVVLDNISLDIEKGETMVIVGQSGCGKTTLLKNITGIQTPTSGSVIINGKDVTKISIDELNEIRKRIGVVFQSSALFNSMTIKENVALSLREHSDLDEEAINNSVKMLLDIVSLTGFEHLKPAEISEGMKKRVGLARAVALHPEIVFYDEPTVGLDPVTSAVIDGFINDLSTERGITSIIVTHKMESAFRVADRITMLYEGGIQQIGTVDEIKNTTNSIVKQFITGTAPEVDSVRKAEDKYLKRKFKEEA